MRLLVAAIIAAMAYTGAEAQTYRYTARTAAPVKLAGRVTAQGLTWTCKGTTCVISGPWATPGVPACAALVREVGRIIEYGHPGAQLDASQLATCNGEAPASKTEKSPVNPNILDSSRRRLTPLERQVTPSDRQLLDTLPPIGGGSDNGGASGGAPEIAIQEDNYENYTLYVRAPNSVEFHGVYDGAYPASTDETPQLTWSGDSLRLPALHHVGLDDPGETVVPAGRVPADSVDSIEPSGRFVEIPLRFSKIPQRVSDIEIACSFSDVPRGTGVYVGGIFSPSNLIGDAHGTFWQRSVSDGDWTLNTTARLPINLRHFMQPQDIKTVTCDVRVRYLRLGGGGADSGLLERAADPSSREFVPGLAADPATSSVYSVDANVES